MSEKDGNILVGNLMCVSITLGTGWKMLIGYNHMITNIFQLICMLTTNLVRRSMK